MQLRAVSFMAASLFLGACSAAPPDGATLAQEKGCVACHGIDGRAIAPSYPNLTGQWERYIRLQLIAYRSGDRNNAVMNGMAASLTDADINAIAEHYGD